jgi:hypothetical protein
MTIDKLHVIKDYDKLSGDIKEQIKITYPLGFSRHLIKFKDKNGLFVSALPFETGDKYYLMRMTHNEARVIIEVDDDYDDAGSLKAPIKEEYSGKHADKEFLFDREIKLDGSDEINPYSDPEKPEDQTS